METEVVADALQGGASGLLRAFQDEMQVGILLGTVARRVLTMCCDSRRVC
jgi:hypothetical protein